MSNPFSKDIAKDFQKAIAPRSVDERNDWQIANKNWWETNPMRYDFFEKPIEFPQFSADFFREVDRRFFRTVLMAFPWKSIPFDNFIDFDSLKTKDVLEIGVGMGTHAEIISTYAKSYTGIDLTEYAVNQTRARFNVFGRNGRVLQMDAEQMDFPDASFDFVWSWGVIHHSADTRRILEQIHRILKPGGTLTFMVYHQSIWNTFVRGWLYYGLIKGGLFRGNNAHQLIQENTDGAIARYYTIEGLRQELGDKFQMTSTTVLGSKLQLIPMKYSPLKERLSEVIPSAFGQWLTNRAFFGYMVVANCTRVG